MLPIVSLPSPLLFKGCPQAPPSSIAFACPFYGTSTREAEVFLLALEQSANANRGDIEKVTFVVVNFVCDSPPGQMVRQVLKGEAASLLAAGNTFGDDILTTFVKYYETSHQATILPAVFYHKVVTFFCKLFAQTFVASLLWQPLVHSVQTQISNT